MKREEKEGVPENEISIHKVSSLKLSMEKAEKEIENILKDVVTQTRKTTEKNVKFKDMVDQKLKTKINLNDNHEFKVKTTSLAHHVEIG